MVSFICMSPGFCWLNMTQQAYCILMTRSQIHALWFTSWNTILGMFKKKGYTCKEGYPQNCFSFFATRVHPLRKEFGPEVLFLSYRVNPFSEGLWYTGKLKSQFVTKDVFSDVKCFQNRNWGDCWKKFSKIHYYYFFQHSTKKDFSIEN